MFFMGRCSVGKQEITTIERVDTVVVEIPMPYKVEVVRKVSVPVYVPMPADTVVVARVDSVLIEVPVEVENREYKSEDYRAIVSGAVVGDIHPTLESMEVYARNEVKVVEHNAPILRPYISASVGREMMGIGGGVSIKDRVDIGAKYIRMGNANAVAIEMNYRFNVKGK
jgi:hypothetical protein